VWDRAIRIRRTEKSDPEQSQRVSARDWRTEARRTYGAASWGIISPMTRHKHAHTGLVTPQLPQLLLTAALRVLAMLVLHVASTLQMICRRRPVIGTQAMPSDLPKAKTDIQHKETTPAAKQDSPIAFILSSTQSVRPSKDEGVLTSASAASCHPGNAKRYPGPTHHVGQPAQWFSALRFASAGMTTVGAFRQQTGSVNSVHAFPAKAGIQTPNQKSAQCARLPDSRLRGRRGSRDHAQP